MDAAIGHAWNSNDFFSKSKENSQHAWNINDGGIFGNLF